MLVDESDSTLFIRSELQIEICFEVVFFEKLSSESLVIRRQCSSNNVVQATGAKIHDEELRCIRLILSD